MASKREAWLSLLPADPRPALLASEEPFARFVAMTAVLGKSEDDAAVRSARKGVVADPQVRALVDRLPAWESGFTFGGHNSPGFPPNVLRLLHGMGVCGGDSPAIERMFDQMLRHQAEDGRFLTPGGTTGKKPSAWASLPCDHFAILEVLLLFSVLGATRPRRSRTCSATARASSPASGHRPGTTHRLCWMRSRRTPPSGRARPPRSRTRRSTAEIVRALATTFGADGMVTPRSCYKGFETYSFGQQKKPSPWATAKVCGLLRAFSSVLDGRNG